MKTILSDEERSEENIEFWDAFVDELKLDRPIIITASISHRFIISWINKHSTVRKLLNNHIVIITINHSNHFKLLTVAVEF